MRYARRVGWYAFIRALKPEHVVETGVDKGLGTCVIAAALLRNAAEDRPGRVTSIDINPEAGYLARQQPWSEVVDLVIGDSITTLAGLDRATASAPPGADPGLLVACRRPMSAPAAMLRA